MLAWVKLLITLGDAIPALRSLLIDLSCMLRDLQAQARRNAKDTKVNSTIDDAIKRMRNR